MREREWGWSGSYAVPLKPRTYIAIRSNQIQSVYNQCAISVQSEMSPNPHPPSQCPISVQSVYNPCPIREVSQSTPTISVSNQCTISVQSVSNQCPISVQSVSNQCTISVQSVYNQCTISVQSEMYISQSTPTIEAETRQLP